VKFHAPFPASVIVSAGRILLYVLPFKSQTSFGQSLLFVCFCVCFGIGSHHVAQAGLKLMVLLPQPPECWDYSGVPPDPAFPYSLNHL
jgi:hypothetical protein